MRLVAGRRLKGRRKFKMVKVFFMVMVVVMLAVLITAATGGMEALRVEVSGTHTLGSLDIGDKVVDPSWEWEHRTGDDYSGTGETKPVTWIVVAKDHYGSESSVILLAEELIGLHAFDNSTDRDHFFAEYGYNHWGESGTGDADRGLRPWLNSSGIHSGEGFYNAFSAAFQTAIVQVTIPNRRTGAGEAYSTLDQVFIPSTTELGDTTQYGTYEIGSVYTFYSDASNADRIAQLGGANRLYWTRSPGQDHGELVRGVTFAGVFTCLYANKDGHGIRPALNLKPETLVSETQNADGAYEIIYDAVETPDLDPAKYTTLYWQNNQTGLRFLWFMDGHDIIDMDGIGTFGAGVWNIVGVGDLDGDGKTDIVWHNTQTGLLYVWMMDGRVRLNETGIGVVENHDWKAVAVGDMNGNGNDDIIWENTANGNRLVWLMDGTTLDSFGDLPSRSLEWTITGAADMNGNGHTDLVWQNITTAEREFGLMQGLTEQQVVPLEVNIGPEWQISTVGDFNGNGHADLVWTNTETGLRYVEYWEDLERVGGDGIGIIADLNWQIVGVQ